MGFKWDCGANSTTAPDRIHSKVKKEIREETWEYIL